MSQSKISSTLVDAYISGGFGLPTIYENKVPDELPAPPFARVFESPNQPSVVTLGNNGEDSHDGFFQIDLNYPLNEGSGDALAKVDEMRAHFKAGTRFTYNGQAVTIRSCGRSAGRQIDGYFQISITINWYARTAR